MKFGWRKKRLDFRKNILDSCKSSLCCFWVKKFSFSPHIHLTNTEKLRARVRS